MSTFGFHFGDMVLNQDASAKGYLNMLKSKITPDPIRDAPVGEHQSPGQHIIVPARAYGDVRFNKFPATFRVLVICSAHASARAGIFFCNQSHIASVMECSQQAVSQHMVKLMKFGYIEKIRRENKARQYGKQGAKWRMIYDPRMTMTQAIANSNEGDAETARETLEKIQPKERQLSKKQIEYAEQITTKMLKAETEYFSFDKVFNDVKKFMATDQSEEEWKRLGNGLQSPMERGLMKPNLYKPQLVKEEIKNKSHLVNDVTKNKPKLVSENKSKLVHNNFNLTSNISISEIEKRKICNIYMSIIKKYYNTNWSYDYRQMELVEELFNHGYTEESFVKDAEAVIKWNKTNNKTPPQSLAWFVARKKNKDKPMNVTDIVKKTAKGFKYV